MFENRLNGKVMVSHNWLEYILVGSNWSCEVMSLGHILVHQAAVIKYHRLHGRGGATGRFVVWCGLSSWCLLYVLM